MALTEQRREYQREYRRRRKPEYDEKAKARQKRWRADNPERGRVHRANCSARQKGRDATLTIEEWLEILERYESRCVYCFGPFQTLDHVVPIHKGGGSTKDNCVPCCTNCNSRKGRSELSGRRQNWVPSIASEFWPSVAEAIYAQSEEEMKQRKKVA